MIVADAYIGRKRVHRIYKGGELVWYAGELLPLASDVFADVIETGQVGLLIAPILDLPGGESMVSYSVCNADNNLIIAPLTLGIAEGHSYVSIGADSAGTALCIVPFEHAGMQYVAIGASSHLAIPDGVFGNRKEDVLVDTTHEANIFCPDAVIGSQEADFLIALTHKASGIPAWAAVGSHFGFIWVQITYHSTGIAAEARTAAHKYDALLKVSYFSTGISVRAVTAQGENAVHVSIRYKNGGIVARALPGCHDVALETDQGAELHGLSAVVAYPFFDGESAIKSFAESTVHINPAVLLGGNIADCIVSDVERNGTVASAVCMDGKYTSNMQTKTDGGLTGNIKAVMLASQASMNLPCAVDGCLTETEAVMLASEYTTDLSFSTKGSLTVPKIISLASDKAVNVTIKTEAHLTTWLNPIQTGTDLYIGQIYDGWQNGTDLVLSDNYSGEVIWLDPLQTDNDLYIRQVYEYVRDGVSIILASENWMNPIQMDADLHIRQIYKANQTGSSLVIGDSYPGMIAWRNPIQSGTDLYIGQVYESRQHSTKVDLSEI